MKTKLLNVLTAVILLIIPTFGFAAAPPLGTTANFALFSTVGAVTNVGTYKYLTHITGNVGTNSGSSTNFGNVNGGANPKWDCDDRGAKGHDQRAGNERQDTKMILNGVPADVEERRCIHFDIPRGAPQYSVAR